MIRKTTKYIVIHREEVDNWADEYNAMIDFDGTVHISERFGLDGKAAHALNFNSISIGVAFRGCFAVAYKAVHKHPTPEQWAAGIKFVKELMERYQLGPGNVFGHTELGPGATRDTQKLKWEYSCPGSNFDLDAFRAALSQSLVPTI